ncbi:hypothetical protein YC2023_047714 [Brassica napus]
MFTLTTFILTFPIFNGGGKKEKWYHESGKHRLICFNLSELCKDAGLVGCREFCRKWGYYFGLCAKFKGCCEKDKYALSSVMEKLSQRFASPSCHRVIGDIPMGKQCAMTIVGEIKTNPDIVMLILNVVPRLHSVSCCFLYSSLPETPHASFESLDLILQWKELKEETQQHILSHLHREAVLHKLKDWLQTLPMARHRLKAGCAALMAEKLVFSAEAIILCVTALIF